MPLSDSNRTNDTDEALVSEVINDSAVQAIINVTGVGVTCFANVNNTAVGNLEGRKFVRVFNRGRNIRWRIFGQLTGNNGETIGRNEAVEFEYGENIVIELREQNGDNEIDVIITEAK